MDLRVPPPPAPLCLERPYPSSQKGGTLIAADVLDLDSHARRICISDSYRPAACLHDLDGDGTPADRESAWDGLTVEVVQACGSFLTTVQTEVLELLARGHSQKDVAAIRATSVQSVSKTRQQAHDRIILHLRENPMDREEVFRLLRDAADDAG